jgi:hypothetical protein
VGNGNGIPVFSTVALVFMRLSQRLWQVAALLMTAGLLASLAWLVAPIWQERGVDDSITVVVGVLLGPLLVLLVPLIAFSLDLGEMRQAKGELERLLEQKQEGGLSQRARRVPDRSARVPHADSAPTAQDDADFGLDRLVRLKRQGDLATRPSATQAGTRDEFERRFKD